MKIIDNINNEFNRFWNWMKKTFEKAIEEEPLKIEKKIIKIKLSRKSAEELADMKIKLGLAMKGDRKELI